MNDALKSININLNYLFIYSKEKYHDANYKMIKDSIFKDLTVKMIKTIFIYLIKVYKLILSPILGPSDIFSCSIFQIV